jgi:hypothetical protein
MPIYINQNGELFKVALRAGNVAYRLLDPTPGASNDIAAPAGPFSGERARTGKNIT